MTREQVQNEGKQAYFKTDGKATIMIGTGGGKSKVAVEIAKEVDPVQILFLSNSTRGRDITFRDEFEKWGAKELWEKRVVAECYQTAYKWKDKYFPLVIVDEIDFAMTDEFVQFFLNNKYDRLVGLTGFITPEKRELLNTIAPVCYEKSTQELQELGILNTTQFVRIEFDLDMANKNRKVEYKSKGQTKTFYQTENEQYIYWQNQYVKALSELRTIDHQIDELGMLVPTIQAGDLNAIEKSLEQISKLEKLRAKTTRQLRYAAGKRKELLLSLNSSRDIINKIVTKEVRQGNKVLVFSKRTDQIDSICKYTYHSKNKKDNTNIDKLNRGEINVLGVCDAINRGENLNRVGVLIKESYDGSETAFQQQHGRGTRLAIDEIMKYYILVPYYNNPVMLEGKMTYVRVATQAVQWANNMTNSFDTSNTVTINAKDL